MKDRMKVMIAYDGSTYADDALNDLQRAGLPLKGEALVVSVGEVLMAPSLASHELIEKAISSRRVISAIALAQAQTSEALGEAQRLALEASRRVQSYFPAWEVRGEALAGTPSQQLLEKAARWKPDLIVLGSQGRSALGRFFLGSVSKEVATRACCSVRVARRADERVDRAPLRLILGVDGSPGAAWAIRAVGMREWPVGTEVRLIAVDNGNGPARITNVPPSLEELVKGFDEGPPVNARLMAEGARVVLRAAKGLSASVEIREGDPRRVLIEETRKWMADAIFVGSDGLGAPDKRSGLGSVSAELVTNAISSVEVVR